MQQSYWKPGRLIIQQQAILGGMTVLLYQYPFGGLLAEIPKMGFVQELRQLGLLMWSFIGDVTRHIILSDRGLYPMGFFQYLYFSAGIR
jgi:hypothetical protein